MGSPQLNSNPLAHWWTRVSGGREVLRIAMPLVISSLSLTIMTFVDRLFLKQVSAEAMAAAFTAGTVWFAVVCLPLGLCAYSTTFVSQYLGNGQPERIGGRFGRAFGWRWESRRFCCSRSHSPRPSFNG